MNTQRVDMFISVNGKYLDSDKLSLIREKLLSLDDQKWDALLGLNFKDPLLILIISLLFWFLDRFIIEDIGLGILKVLTFGGFGIWIVVDWFIIMKRTRRKNTEKLLSLIA